MSGFEYDKNTSAFKRAMMPASAVCEEERVDKRRSKVPSTASYVLRVGKDDNERETVST